MKRLFPQRLLWIALILLAAILIANIALLAAMSRHTTAASPTTTPAATATAQPVDLLIITAPDCTDCFNASLYRPQLEGIGVKFGTVTTHSLGDAAAGKLIATYGITKLPALVFSKELGTYSTIAQAWSSVGTVADDGSYILQGSNPPYYDLTTKSVQGMVQVILLGDKACTSCYDPSLHLQVLQRYGMGIGSQQEIDVSSAQGKALLAQYNITEVPTLLLRGEPGLYPNFDQVWQSVGTVEPDGTYVFRNLAALNQPYMDLVNGSVVTPPPATQ